VTIREAGLTALVTGSTAGIGRALAAALAEAGVTVGIVARDAGRGEATQREIAAAAGTEVRLFVADLSRQADVRRLAREAIAAFPRLDIVVHAAAVFTQRRTVTSDGLEAMFATNQLAPFLLTNLLRDHLIASAPARVDAMFRALSLADSEMYGGYIVEDSLARRPIPLEIVGRPYFIGKYTTAWDLARLERALHLAAGARGALVWRFPGAFTPSDARFLLYLLVHSRTRGGLTSVWGGGVTVLHKAGWIVKARHDSGLVYSSGGAFVVTVLAVWIAAAGEVGRQDERKQREARRGAHGGEVGEVDGDRLPAPVLRLGEGAAEVASLHQHVGGDHQAASGSGPQHGGVVTDADLHPPVGCGREASGEPGDQPELAELGQLPADRRQVTALTMASSRPGNPARKRARSALSRSTRWRYSSMRPWRS